MYICTVPDDWEGNQFKSKWLPEWKSQFLQADFFENMQFYHTFGYSIEFIWWILFILLDYQVTRLQVSTFFKFIWRSSWWLSQCRSRLIWVVEDQVFNSLIWVQMTWNGTQMLPRGSLTKFWYWTIGVIVVVGVRWAQSMVGDITWFSWCQQFFFQS